MRHFSPDANASGHWNYTYRPNGEIHDDLFIPCEDQDLGLSNTTNSFPLESHFSKPVDLSSCLSRFCTSLHVSSSEPPRVQIIRNNLFLPHPYEQEFPVPLQTQNFPQIQQPNEDFSYQTNEHQVHRHLELLEDVVASNFNCSAGTNSIPVLPPLESPQYGIISRNNENSKINEIGGVTNGCLVSKITTEEHFDTNHSASGAEVSNKQPRIRWTQGLHGCFMRAVTDLGGADRATPKNIMIKMGVGGLTICQVKSHLQKYRLGRHQQQAKEDKGTSTSEGQKKIVTDKEENSSPQLATQNSEVLRMQWELQKRLHDQLEFQKELQLQAEKNAQQLEKLLEEQKRVGQTFVLATTQSCSASTSTPPSSPPSAMAKTNGFSRKGEKHRDQDQNSEDTDSVLELPSTSQKKARLNTSEDSSVKLLSVPSNTST